MPRPVKFFIAKKGDRLLASERNAIILYVAGAKRAAALALGWNARGDHERFLEEEIERIRRKVAEIATQVGEKEDEMRDEKPLRVDEREAEPPLPPEEERLDERVEEVPPTPSKPPEREPEPEDSVAA